MRTKTASETGRCCSYGNTIGLNRNADVTAKFFTYKGFNGINFRWLIEVFFTKYVLQALHSTSIATNTHKV